MRTRKWLTLVGSAVIVLLVIAVSLLAACSSAPTPAPAPAPAPKTTSAVPAPAAPAAAASPSAKPAAPAAPAASASAKPAASPAPAAAPLFNLKFAWHSPASAEASTFGAEPWARSLEAATKNRIKLTTYPGETLAKTTEVIDRTVAGVIDLSWAGTSFNPGRYNMSDLISLPGLGIGSSLQGSRVRWDMIQQYPEVFAKEYADVKLITVWTGGPYVLASKKPVRTPDDIKGMKLRAAGAPQVEALKAMGVSPIASLSAVDIYDATSKGVIDGVLIDWTAMGTYKIYEVAKCMTELQFASSPMHLVMNLNVWNKLPKDIQDQIMSIGGMTGAEFWASKHFDRADQMGRDAFKKAMAKDTSMQLINLTKEQLIAFRNAATPSNTKYVTDLEAKGFPAKKVYDGMITLIDKWAGK